MIKRCKKLKKLPIFPVLLLIASVFFAYAPLTWALELPNFWETMDKQAYEEFKKKHYKAAEDLFEDPVWHGVTLYKLGRYQEAIKAFKKVKTPLSLYNLGNSYAQLGQFKAAEKAYQDALKLHPNPQLKSKITHNLNLVQKLLKQNTASHQTPQNKPHTAAKPNQQPQKPPKTSKPHQEEKNRDKKAEKPAQTQSAKHEQKAHNQGSKDSSTTQQKSGKATQTTHPQGRVAQDTQKTLKQGEKSAKNLKLGDQAAQQSETKAALAMPPKTQKNSEQKQAQQTWFNQIPDEPQRFIQRKFEYQYQQQQPRPEPKKIW